MPLPAPSQTVSGKSPAPTVWETLADVSSRMEGEARLDGELERSELREGEQAGISLSQRLRAGAGQCVQMRLVGGECFDLTILENSQFWVLGETARGHTLVPTTSIVVIGNLPVHAGVWSGKAVSELSFASMLRVFMHERRTVVAQTHEGTFRGVIVAIGADWMEMREADASGPALHPTVCLAHIRRIDVVSGGASSGGNICW